MSSFSRTDTHFQENATETGLPTQSGGKKAADRQRDKLYVLQNVIFPGKKIFGPDTLYLRGNYVLDRNAGTVRVPDGHTLLLDTYFNMFSLEGMGSLGIDLQDLYFSLYGKGRAIIRIYRVFMDRPPKLVLDESVNLSEGILLDLGETGRCKTGLLAVHVTPQDGDILLTGGAWQTSTPPRRQVKLAIVITHFNQQEAVAEATERIKEGLLKKEEWKEKVELFIVDNSRNLDLPPIDGVTILKNRNLGGAGGFMRGLIHVQDRKEFTHCLFMDDDASCEIESIKRAVNALEYTKENDLSIAGSLIDDYNGHTLIERGATFNVLAKPLFNGLNLEIPQNIIDSESKKLMTKNIYGAWCFFCFNLKEANKLAFPFFVRGDDILFSLDNKFNIKFLNGICVWVPNFCDKENAFSFYLVNRSILMINILNFPMKSAYIASLKIAKFFIKKITLYQYSRAEMALIAIENVMQGYKFWMENMEIDNLRNKYNYILNEEKNINLSNLNQHIIYNNNFESERILRKFFRYITLNGYILPSYFIKKGYLYQNTKCHAKKSNIFRYRNILYVNREDGTAFIASMDRRRALRLSLRMMRLLVRFMIKLPRLREEYLKEGDYMRSREFWEKQFAHDEHNVR